jgi:hypothetical protein
MARKKPTTDLDDDFGEPTAAPLSPIAVPSNAEIEQAASSYSVEGSLEEAEIELRDMLVTDPEKIVQSFTEMPSQIAWAATRHAQAVRTHLRTKARARRLRGLLEIQAREELRQFYPKPTESQVAARTEQDARWVVAQEEEIEAEVSRELTKGLLEAARCKRDMLISIGATLRAELERDPVIRDRMNVR